jgi:hypothetical protein
MRASARLGYVSISRARHEATVFTNNGRDLGQQLGAEISKTSALEIIQAPTADLGIGIQ